MSVLSDLRDDLHRLADRAGAADQPDPLTEASRALPERVREILTEHAAKLARVLAELIPAAPEAEAPADPGADPGAEPAADPGAEPPAGGDPAPEPGEPG